jgi:hypothetical protein
VPPPGDGRPAVWCVGKDGVPIQECYYEDDKCHRDPAEGPAWKGLEDDRFITAYVIRGMHHRPEQDGPAARICDAATGRLIREEYYHYGKLHRIGGPAYLEYREDGSLLLESWRRHGIQHRDPENGPASTMICEDGGCFEEYFVDGRYHRDPAIGPACIKRNAAGQVVNQIYWVRGEVHRDPRQGPARIGYDGNTEETEYYQNDQRHREDGPAVIHRDRATGEILKQEYWLHGERVDAPLTEEISQ